jgi:hypothetical protein
MSRNNAIKTAQMHGDTAKHRNVTFVQGDCLRVESYPSEIEHVDAIVHTVGAITDLIDYKFFLNNSCTANPALAMQHLAPASYENSLEAQNRDSCKLIAEKFQ